MKVVINKCFGGFGLSEAAYKELGMEWDKYGYGFRGKRSDPALVACVEKLRDKASGAMARLKVVKVPDGVKFEIEDYDGIESIHEKHRSWG